MLKSAASIGREKAYIVLVSVDPELKAVKKGKQCPLQCPCFYSLPSKM